MRKLVFFLCGVILFTSAVLQPVQAVAGKLPKGKHLLKKTSKAARIPKTSQIQVLVPPSAALLGTAAIKAPITLPQTNLKPVSLPQTPQYQETFARVKKAKNKKLRITFNKYEKIQSILEDEHDVLGALKKVWNLQDQYGRHDFFEIFALAYYHQHFRVLTPHLRQLFETVSKAKNRDLEYALIKRMRFLSMNRDNFRAVFAPNIPKVGMRMRYLRDVKYLAPDNFSPNDLVFSFERKMDPGQAENAIIRQVRVDSQFPAGQKTYPVYRYNGSADLLPNLYRYLLNGKKLRSPLLMVFDDKMGALAMYNQDRSVWLRVTAHEYSNLEKLHIHLNETRTATITTIMGLEAEETVHFNLSIPMELPKDFPYHLSKEEQKKWLYHKFVEHPVKHFQGDDRVTILYRSIF